MTALIGSAWEIANKTSTGKIELHAPFEDLFPGQLLQNDLDL